MQDTGEPGEDFQIDLNKYVLKSDRTLPNYQRIKQQTTKAGKSDKWSGKRLRTQI